MKNISGKILFAVALVALIIGTYLRFENIELRPLHHDESVNHFFLQQTHEKGYYPYSHENYHGPTHFYMLVFSNWLLGNDSELALRLPSIVSSILILLPLIGLLPYLRLAGMASAVTLLMLSSSLIFFARYSIHEVFFITQTLWLAVATFCWKQTHKTHWLYQGAIALSLLILTKETYVIAGFCIFCGYLAIESPLKDFAKLSEQRKALAWSFFILFLLTIGIVSGGFQWMGGVRELFLSVPQWIGRNTSDTGHHKPFEYYSEVLSQTEPWLFLFPLAAVVVTGLAFWKKEGTSIFTSRDYALQRFMTLWALSSFLIYSYLKYKMPWLIINITVPSILALSSWIAAISAPQLMKSIFLIALAVASYHKSVQYTFTAPYGPKNPFSYVHTSKGMMDLLDDIRAYWKENPEAKVLIGTDQYWPIPYYVRDHTHGIAYVRSKKPESYKKRYGVIVVDHRVQWSEPGWERKYYRLADNQESHAFFFRGTPEVEKE